MIKITDDGIIAYFFLEDLLLLRRLHRVAQLHIGVRLLHLTVLLHDLLVPRLQRRR